MEKILTEPIQDAKIQKWKNWLYSMAFYFNAFYFPHPPKTQYSYNDYCVPGTILSLLSLI